MYHPLWTRKETSPTTNRFNVWYNYTIHYKQGNGFDPVTNNEWYNYTIHYEQGPEHLCFKQTRNILCNKVQSLTDLMSGIANPYIMNKPNEHLQIWQCKKSCWAELHAVFFFLIPIPRLKWNTDPPPRWICQSPTLLARLWEAQQPVSIHHTLVAQGLDQTCLLTLINVSFCHNSY